MPLHRNKVVEGSCFLDGVQLPASAAGPPHNTYSYISKAGGGELKAGSEGTTIRPGTTIPMQRINKPSSAVTLGMNCFASRVS